MNCLQPPKCCGKKSLEFTCAPKAKFGKNHGRVVRWPLGVKIHHGALICKCHVEGSSARKQLSLQFFAEIRYCQNSQNELEIHEN